MVARGGREKPTGAAKAADTPKRIICPRLEHTHTYTHTEQADVWVWRTWSGNRRGGVDLLAPCERARLQGQREGLRRERSART